MANSLGSLVVSLGLNAAEFTSGLTKAEYQAKKFSDNLSSSFAAAGKIAGVGLGLVAAAALSASKEIIESAAALNDFADQTGSSVESLSKLANQAQIAGTDFGTLQGLVLKLTAGMAGADDESSNVGRALKALGVTAKDPAQALQDIAIALSKYADGVGKAAIARDLFGKSGPQFLATLKDIAELGHINATVTAEQAAEAEKLEKAFRTLAYESTTLKNALLSNVVPALNELITNFKLAREAGVGFLDSLKLGSEVSSDNIGARIEFATKKLEKLKKQLAAAGDIPLVGQNSALPLTRFLINETDVREAEKELKALLAIGAATNKLNASRGKDILPPELKYTGAKDRAERVGRIPKDQISDAQRYLEQLEQQLQKTQELTVVETVLADIESGRLKLSDDVSTAKLLQVAQLIDAAKAQEKAERELQKVRADEARTREQISAMTTRTIAGLQAETDALAEQNKHYREETELIGKDAASIAQIVQARLDNEIALKKEALAAAINAGAQKDITDQYEDQIRLLGVRKTDTAARGVAESLAAAAASAKEYNDLFVNSFADAAASVVTHTQSIGKAIRSMEATIVASISRIAAKKLGEALFGAATSSGGGGLFGGLGGLLNGLFGGGSGGSFIPYGGGLAVGTSYARGGLTLVGERGPEIVDMPRGAKVTPNNKIGSIGGNNISVSVNVLPGASRATAEQAALRTGVEIQRALNRIG